MAAAHREALDQPIVDGAVSAVTFVPTLPRRRSLSATAQRSVVRKLIRDPESSLGKLGWISHGADREIWRIRVRISGSMAGRPGRPSLLRRQWSRKRRFCHSRTVRG